MDPSMKIAFASVVETFVQSPLPCILASIGINKHMTNKRSEADDDTLCIPVLNALHSTCIVKHRKKKRAKVEGYVNLVVPHYTDHDFKSHFRVTRNTVQTLMELLPKVPKDKPRRPGLLDTDRQRVVLMSLWTLGNPESFRGIADRFGLGVAHAHREFTRFCTQLFSIKADIIKWPVGHEAALAMLKFQQLLGEKSFPDVIGCLGGTNVRVTAPAEERQSGFNGKQFTSVIVQAVCDADMRFTDVFTGWPGCSHDQHVWRNSPLLAQIECNREKITAGAHILGDMAYVLATYLMVPYKCNDHLTSKQELFNKRLSSTRVVIEQAFGKLFGRWRRLQRLHMFRLDRVSNVILAACVLHNLCISEGDSTPEEFEMSAMNNTMEFGNEDCPTKEAEEKREKITDYLYEHAT